MEKLLMELKAIEDCPVQGHLKMIDDVRLVFIGQDPNKTDIYYLAFRNEDGEDTKIKLSTEAYNALKCLISEPFKGKRVGFPYKLEWSINVTEENTND